MKTHRFKQHELRPLTDRSTPRTWLFTDTETKVTGTGDNKRHVFYMGWCLLCEDFDTKPDVDFIPSYFDNNIEYLKYINDQAIKYGDLLLCGHNIFFDIQAAGFFRWFHAEGWKLDYLYDQGLTFILKIIKGPAKLLVLSTTNWYDCSVRELGNMLGFKKLNVDFDNVTDRQLKKYCKRDTEIIVRAMKLYLKFLTDNGLGKFCYTKASQSLSAYRTAFIQDKIFIHNEKNIHELERAAYMGGRTEAFYIGKCPVDDYVILDINAMYPFVMSRYSYPSKLLCYIEEEPLERYTDVLQNYLIIADCTVNTSDPVYATRYKGKTVFPVGTFDVSLCSEGFKHAIGNGHVKQVRRAAVYTKADLFTGYVNYFHQLRQDYQKEGNKVFVKLCKYMHNSLYGKWGERQVVTQKFETTGGIEFFRDEIYDMVKGGSWIETFLFGTQMLQHFEGETSHSAPAIAAHITENARLTLWSLIDKIGRERVLYCDTDSVIIRESDMRRVKDLISDTELGKLKIQSRFRKLQIDGAKNYRAGDMRHIKGIPSSAKEVHPGTFEYLHFKRMCMCLRQCISQGVPFETMTRRLVSPYDKGTVTSTGRVLPLVFPVQT